MRESVERKLAKSFELLEAAQDVVFVLSLDGVFQQINSFGSRRFGSTPSAIVGRRLEGLLPEAEARQLGEALRRMVESGKVVYFEHRLSREDGGWWLHTSLSPLSDEEGRLFAALGIARDVTEMVSTREELRTLTLVDELTTLYNRRGFLALAQQQLKLAERLGRPISLLLADLDGLKQINDDFGHHAGDQVLIATANILVESCRESDIVARLGGDEFVILAVGASPSGAESLASRVREAVRKWNARTANSPRLSLSIGIVRYDPDEPCSIDDLLKRVDASMYREKKKKRV